MKWQRRVIGQIEWNHAPYGTILAWKSFNHQLQPGMTLGIATVVMPPQKLLVQFQWVYFKCLPSLNVNCHIKLSWRVIPERYQGLGLTNFALVLLSSKLSFIQWTCGLSNVDSRSLMMGYESFMVEIGLYDNTMVYNCKGIFNIGNKWHLVQKRLGTGSLLQNKVGVPVRLLPWPGSKRW